MIGIVAAAIGSAIAVLALGAWLLAPLISTSIAPATASTVPRSTLATVSQAPTTAVAPAMVPAELITETTDAPDTHVAIQPWESEIIGKSVKGKPIEALQFGSGTRRLLIIGGVHGDEYGADAAEQIVERLKANPSLVPDGTEIHVIPVVNPDGRASSSRGNANGVDINRNMPSKNWSSKLDKRDSSGARGLRGGSAPASEPESKAFIDYMSRGFFTVVSLHSKGGLVDYDGPGGDTLAKKIAAKSGLPAKHLGYQAYITGSMGIYIPEEYGIPVITIELNSPDVSDRLAEAILLPATE